MLAQTLKKISQNISSNMFAWAMTFYPPFIGAGISVKKISKDFTYIKVQMKLTWYNRNYVGTQFGGSLYAMTDPFYMLMLLHNLKKDYIVWDKASYIDFIKPGKGTVYAEFKLTPELIADVKARADTEGKYIFDLPVEVKDKNDVLVAKVTKTLYVRNKNFKK